MVLLYFVSEFVVFEEGFVVFVFADLTFLAFYQPLLTQGKTVTFNSNAFPEHSAFENIEGKGVIANIEK